MTINLYIGGNNRELADTAGSVDSRAFLIDHSNCREFLNSPPTSDVTVYTSLADLPKLSENNNVLYDLLDLADNIYYCPPSVWSYAEMQDFTEKILREFKQQKNNVYNLDISKYSAELITELVDGRKTANQQLWISGCSISHGVGVTQETRYGQLIADSLGLPVSFLTAGGSSIPWAIDQIVRSDVCANDIVVLGLTEEFRFPYWTKDKTLWHIGWSHRNFSNLLPLTNLSSSIIDKLITDDNCVYQSVIRIYQLVNFCRKLNVKLLIVGILSSTELALYLNSIPEFKHYRNFKSPKAFFDLGTDNLHPGTLQHQLYADFCQAALKKLSYI
jgi:hypothetical protein